MTRRTSKVNHRAHWPWLRLRTFTRWLGPFALAFTAWLPGASAEPLVLSWSAPPSCPRAGVVRARVRRLLDSGPSRSRGPLPQVRATVVHATDQFVMSLAIETSSGPIVRELRARDCSLLAESAAVFVALASGSRNEEAGSKTAPSAVPTPTTEPEPSDRADSHDRTASGATGGSTSSASRPTDGATSSATTASAPRSDAVPTGSRPDIAAREEVASEEPSRSSPLPWTGRASLGAGVFANGLPGPRPDLFAELAFSVRWLSAGLRVGHVFGGSRKLPAATSAHYFADYLALSSCGLWGTPRLVAGPCVSLLGSRSHAATQGLADARDRSALWAQVGLGASLRCRLFARGEVGLESGVLLPLSARPQFNVVNVGTLEQGSVVSGYSHIDVALRFE